MYSLHIRNLAHIIYIKYLIMLPEKWAIKRTIDNYGKIEEWYFKNVKVHNTLPENGGNPYLHFPCESCGSNYRVKDGYTEITFEEFEKYVLNKQELSPEIY